MNNNNIYQTYSFSGKSINCYGLSVVKNSLQKLGFVFEDFTLKNNNIVLFSIYWPEQIYDFIKFRYKKEMKNKPVIVGGNTATTNPGILLSFMSSVFVGSGEIWDGTVTDKHILNPEENKKVDIAQCDTIIPIKFEDIQSNRRSFCEMSRGCKNKCLFCQYGWLKKYIESDLTDIKEIIKTAKTKSVRLFAADRFQHTQYKKIRDFMLKLGKCDTGSDVSLRFVFKNPEYLNYTNKIRVGIEGMSERLRKVIGKPVSNDEIIEFCDMVAKAGIKSFDWYMIYGLPTESNEDVEEFQMLLNRIAEKLPCDYCIAIHWNAFTPSAMTPFQWEKPAYGYNSVYIENKIFNLSNKTKIKLMHKPKLTSNKKILSRMLVIRGCKEVSKLIYNVALKPKLLNDEKFILKEYYKNTGIELCEKLNYNTTMPWDKYVNYNKDKMLSIVKAKKLWQ